MSKAKPVKQANKMNERSETISNLGQWWIYLCRMYFQYANQIFSFAFRFDEFPSQTRRIICVFSEDFIFLTVLRLPCFFFHFAFISFLFRNVQMDSVLPIRLQSKSIKTNVYERLKKMRWRTKKKSSQISFPCLLILLIERRRPVDCDTLMWSIEIHSLDAKLQKNPFKLVFRIRNLLLLRCAHTFKY